MVCQTIGFSPLVRQQAQEHLEDHARLCLPTAFVFHALTEVSWPGTVGLLVVMSGGI